MPIELRDLSSKEATIDVHKSTGALATGLTLTVWVAPWPCQINAARAAAVGISGAPTCQLAITRFVVGSGASSEIRGFTSLALQAVGTSGIQSFVTATAGTTVLTMGAGDYVSLTSGGSNAAVADLSVTLVVQALQDLRTHFGS